MPEGNDERKNKVFFFFFENVGKKHEKYLCTEADIKAGTFGTRFYFIFCARLRHLNDVKKIFLKSKKKKRLRLRRKLRQLHSVLHCIF